MPYVPGFHYDVFISYAHASDQGRAARPKGWVTEFQEELENYLTAILHPAPKVYIDHSELRKAGAYPQDLARDVRRSALLLTINCMPYLGSDFCKWELDEFRKEFGDDPRTTDDGRRIVEVYKSLLPNGSVPKIQRDASGFWFCGNPEKRETPDTFDCDTKQFSDALKVLGKEIVALLFAMRRERQTIFVGPPVDATEQTSTIGSLFRDLRAELRQYYNVVPLSGDVASEDRDLANSLVSVHFISNIFDKPTLARIDKAKEGNRALFVIIAPELRKDPSNSNWALIRTLESVIKSNATDTANKIRLLNWQPLNDQPGDLRLKIAESLPKPENPLSDVSVYIICDPRDVAEDEVGKLLRILEQIRNVDPYGSPHLTDEQATQLFRLFGETKSFEETSGMPLAEQVFEKRFMAYEELKSLAVTSKGMKQLFHIFQALLAIDKVLETLGEEEIKYLFSVFEEIGKLRLRLKPLRSAQGNSDGVIDHISKLHDCDGSLLLWGCAQAAWFKQYHDELQSAPGLRRGRPLSSKAVLIKPKEDWKLSYARQLVPAENLWEGIELKKIATFLISLLHDREQHAASARA